MNTGRGRPRIGERRCLVIPGHVITAATLVAAEETHPGQRVTAADVMRRWMEAGMRQEQGVRS